MTSRASRAPDAADPRLPAMQGRGGSTEYSGIAKCAVGAQSLPANHPLAIPGHSLLQEKGMVIRQAKYAALFDLSRYSLRAIKPATTAEPVVALDSEKAPPSSAGPTPLPAAGAIGPK